MFCYYCGSKLDDGVKFCPDCGKPVTAALPVQRTVTPVQHGNAPVQPTQTPVQPVYQELNAETPHPVQPAQPVYTEPVIPPVNTDMPVQKDTVYVRKLPIIAIIVLTLGFTFCSYFTENLGMNVALAVSCIPGIILMFLIYRLDTIEPEPIPLLIRLFLGGALIATIVSILIETVLGYAIAFIAAPDSIVYSFLEAFIMAAATEELCKYFILKRKTWKNPAFNYRFDGVVYSTTVAIGFEIMENVLYIIDSTAGTAFARAAFPGHCVFGIYMGYFYGQAKNYELRGDIAGAKAMRIKGILTAILIHGTYDFICFLASGTESELIALALGLVLTAVMVVLNVSAYKNIKKFAGEDAPV